MIFRIKEFLLPNEHRLPGLNTIRGVCVGQTAYFSLPDICRLTGQVTPIVEDKLSSDCLLEVRGGETLVRSDVLVAPSWKMHFGSDFSQSHIWLACVVHDLLGSHEGSVNHEGEPDLLHTWKADLEFLEAPAPSTAGIYSTQAILKSSCAST